MPTFGLKTGFINKYMIMMMKSLRVLLLFFSLLLWAVSVEAQCAMCSATVEANTNEGGEAGMGLNTGIFFLLAMPYLLFAVIGILWYRNSKKERNKRIKIDSLLKKSLEE